MTKRAVVFIVLAFGLLSVLSACQEQAQTGEPGTPVPDQTSVPTGVPTGPATDQGGEIIAQVQEQATGPIVSTRQPVPTPPPGFVSERLDRLAAERGLDDDTFLGLDLSDWADLAISIGLVLLGYILARLLLEAIYKWLARVLNEETAAAAKTQLNQPALWLLATLLLRLAIYRLGFLPDYVRVALLDLIYVVTVILLLIVVWRLMDLSIAYYRSLQTDPVRLIEIDPALILITRFGRIFLIVIVGSMVLMHFGINVTALATALGLGGLALSLAARDTVADIIAGVIILFDRPFRVGDRIEIQELGTWGDVVEIGLRTTRIRTRDNRMVIVPNSTINTNQIVNYTYPDPRYRIETRVAVAYGTGIEQLHQAVEEAVRGAEDVLPDKPVDILYDEMGDSGMIFRVRWWINSYTDTPRSKDRVITALQAALDANDMQIPFPTQTIRLESAAPPPRFPTSSKPPENKVSTQTAATSDGPPAGGEL